MAIPYNTDGVLGNKVGAMIFSDEWNSYNAAKWVPYMPHYMNANTSPAGNWEVANSTLRMWALDPIIKENRVFCTETKFHFRFGYFEARIRCPRGAGLWPGWWTYSVDHSLAPTHEEIDFHESYPGGNLANGGQTWGDGNYNPIDYDMTVWNKFTEKVASNRMAETAGFGPTNLAADYFIYGCLWEPDGCTFFFHGRQCGPKMFHAMETDHSLNLQCWTGSASGTVFDEFKNRNHAVEVDWVRAYELSSGTSSMLNIGGGIAIDPATDSTSPTPTPTPTPTEPTPTEPTPTPTPSPTAPSGNLAGTTASLHDEITIIKIRTGAGTVNAILTNQHHILAADKAGVVDTFEDAGTHAIIFEGATDTTKRWDFTKLDGEGVESEIRGNAIKVVAMDTDTGFIDITARRDGYPAQTMKMTLAKSRRTI